MTEFHLPSATSWSSPSGLEVEVERDGSLRRLAFGEIVVNLFAGNALEGGPANLVLRRHGIAAGEVGGVEHIRLLGPRSATRWRIDAVAGVSEGIGEWRGLRYRVALRLAASMPAWFWHVQVENAGAEAVRCDLMLLQDLALAPYGAVRLNEYYVSQYIDHTPLEHAGRGFVLASRQNQAAAGQYPWCAIGSLDRGVGYATDALQVHGLASRAGLAGPALASGLPSTRLQHEHAMAALQDAAFDLAPGESTERGFFGALQANHRQATSAADLAFVDTVLALPEAKAFAWSAGMSHDATLSSASPSFFSNGKLLASTALEESELDSIFGTERRHAERSADGRLLAFFRGHTGDESDDRSASHVVLAAKELAVLRPHGQVLRTGTLLLPDESALTSTAWMGGVFHSMLTQGHVSINRCLSTLRSYIGLFRAQGLRVFVEMDGTWQLLDQPSAFEMSTEACRWVYKHAAGRIDVRSTALSAPHAFGLDIEVIEGPPMRCLVCMHVALNGDDGATAGKVLWTRDGQAVSMRPAPESELGRRFPDGHWRVEASAGTAIESIAGDEALFLDAASRDLPYLTVITAPSRSAGFALVGRFVTGGVDVPAADSPHATSGRIGDSLHVTAPSGSALAAPLSRLAEWLPWLRQNALIHYLSPRGLEQFSGGGWGTRDVCQGPIELLLAHGHDAPMRDILLRVMKAQQPDGDWPQWFMFFERDAAIRAGDSHGDIVFWPLLALAQYLIATGDASILDERTPFYPKRASRPGASHSVWEHALRALALTRRRIIPGTALAAYGHGDWNDALQPADPSMRDTMCSAWSVTLHHQTLTTLATALRRTGRQPAALRLERQAEAIRRDFLRLLLVDDVLAGYAMFGDAKAGDSAAAVAPVRYLLHPRDDTTGVHYSVLAMIHAILEGLFDATQMRHHLQLIDDHLSGPDGTRLFDKPMRYQGGTQRIFQRAESASFFGREIGLMYTHAHLRYAQALAHVGEADRFFHALCQANPIGIAEIVRTATARQSNCYYSSSDAKFADRYQAGAEYERVLQGTIDLDGGWRVYSSGAGIMLSLVVRHLFGLRLEADALLIDPVLPIALDGMTMKVVLMNRAIEIAFHVRGSGCSVTGLQIDGRALGFTEEPNPYRRGAARVVLQDLIESAHGPKALRLAVVVGEASGTT